MSASLAAARAAAPVPAPARWPVLLGAAALLGVLHALLTLGHSVLSPDNPVWQHVQGDRAQAVLGAEAFLRDPAWHFPLTITDRLRSGGAPVSIIYTDSAPWLAIAAKALGLSPDRLNLIGLVALLSVAMQPIAGALLMLAIGVRRAEGVLAGAVLGALMPAWYARLVWHPALASHWIVLLALALACLAIRRGLSRGVVAGLAALGAFAIGIHAYLFVMVAALAVGAFLAEPARDWNRRSLLRAAGGLVAFLACSGFSAWVLGYGGAGPADGYGVFSLNLLSPFLPQHSGLWQAFRGDARPFLDATGGQYQGFSYLGGGNLLVLLAAGLTALASRRVGFKRAAVPLCLVLVALVAFAVSNKVWFGHRLLVTVPLSRGLESLLGEVRSSGRMVWPAAYSALAAAILMLERLPRRAWGAILAGAILLQAADTAPLRRALAAEYVPEPTLVPAAAALWQAPPLAGQDLRFLPSMSCASLPDHETIRQLALRAERAGGAVEGGPLARSAPGICLREQIDAALAPARVGEEQLLLSHSVAPAALALAAMSPSCAGIPEGLLCGNGAAALRVAGRLPPAPVPVLPKLRPGEPVDFRKDGAGTGLLAAGWLAPEGFGTWTEGERSLLVLPLPDGWSGDAVVTLHAIAHGSTPLRSQQVTVLAGGRAIAQFLVSTERWGDYTLRLPAADMVHGMLVLDLVVPAPMLFSRAHLLKRKSHGFGLETVTLD